MLVICFVNTCEVNTRLWYPFVAVNWLWDVGWWLSSPTPVTELSVGCHQGSGTRGHKQGVQRKRQGEWLLVCYAAISNLVLEFII